MTDAHKPLPERLSFLIKSEGLQKGLNQYSNNIILAREKAIAQQLKDILNVTCEDNYNSLVTRKKLILQLIEELEKVN